MGSCLAFFMPGHGAGPERKTVGTVICGKSACVAFVQSCAKNFLYLYTVL